MRSKFKRPLPPRKKAEKTVVSKPSPARAKVAPPAPDIATKKKGVSND